MLPEVSRRFSILLQDIQPRAAEVARARTQVVQIASRLRKAFKVSKIVWVGSHSKDTAIRFHSDVDVFVVIRREDIRWGGGYVLSSTLLRNVREQLQDRFWSTDVRRDQQAVVVHFAQGEHAADVVPAVYTGPGPNNYPVYAIPDGMDGWLSTSPDIHARYLKVKNLSSGGKLVRVIQFVKWWARSRSSAVPLSSFHVEMVLAASNVTVGLKTYSQALQEAFAVLASRQGAAFRDPNSVSGLIAATPTDSQRSSLANALNYAHSHATSALNAELGGNWREAVRQWRIVFNNDFPA